MIAGTLCVNEAKQFIEDKLLKDKPLYTNNDLKEYFSFNGR